MQLDREILRGARGILGWSVAELAAKSNVSVATINSFEQNSVSRRGAKLSQTTVLKILYALENAGIEVTEDGVRRKDLKSFVLRGEDANKLLLDDIYKTLKDKGGEVLISGLSENKPGDATYELVVSHVNRLKKTGITERLLIAKGDTNLIAPKEWYRWFPDDQFNTSPFYLYGNRLALAEWEAPQKVIVIDNPNLAKTYRVMFDAIWKRALPVVLKKP
jgi:transcriptional regulator with XRE-family HTH domain